MGTLRNGLLGHYRGKIGNLVFYVVNGKQVVRTQTKHNYPPTVKQLQNRNELSTVMAFLKPLREFVSIGFAKAASGTVKSPYNMAVSYNKIHAVTGIYPDVVMDYAKVMVSQGNMLPALTPTVELIADGLKFNWLCPAGLEWPRGGDQVMLLAYFPGLQRASYLLHGAARFQCTETLSLPANVLNEHMEVYISFIAQNRKQIADSIYLGSLNG